ncbi:MAG: hypothetical protein CSA38_04630 [Flavobacteriales bacterium]|nr:MAG: hypothetical protein CSA38_04630 [Flavobacteriales bacterium]
MNKRILIFTLLLVYGLSFSQQKKQTYVKGNPLLALVGIGHLGVEHQLTNKQTLQADLLYSPWKTINRKHAETLFLTIEGRHYFNQSFEKWYIGAHIGGGMFNLTKPNYWQHTYENYQKGYNYMIGASVGYQFQWKERWNIDCFIGGGAVESFYKGYEVKDGVTTKVDGATNYNKSSEFLPYRLGLMISYKL